MLKNQLGLSLIELTLGLAITGIVAVPLTAIIGAELRIPAKISGQVVEVRQIQRSNALIIDDARSAQSFVPGSDLNDYGTFSWFEFSGDSPLLVSVRYFWQTEKVKRELNRGGELFPPLIVLEGVEEFDKVIFDYEAPKWSYDSATKNWSYAEGNLDVSITTTRMK